MLLGHASVQTTERYLGTKQDLVHAPSPRETMKQIVRGYWRDISHDVREAILGGSSA